MWVQVSLTASNKILSRQIQTNIKNSYSYITKKNSKKLFVLRCENSQAGAKLAREVKEKHEKLWGKDSCEVVVLAKDSMGESSLEVIPQFHWKKFLSYWETGSRLVAD